MSVTNHWFRGVPVVALWSIMLVACQPATELSTGAAVMEPAAAAPPVRTPIYRSEKRLSSDCGVVRAPEPFPGFAKVAGEEADEMPEMARQWFDIGAERLPVETDLARVAPGYTVVGPISTKGKFIINNDKEVVGRFEGEYFAGHTDVLDNGDLFGTASAYHDHFRSGGRNGCVERYGPGGELLWRVRIGGENYLSHHDVVLLENGNFLAIVWDRVSSDEAIEQGRDPETVAEIGEFWYDGIIEVDPYELEIVWEWSARHHLVQDLDPVKRNYGAVAEHPELIDINTIHRNMRGKITADWTHLNSIDYNPELEQILVSSPHLDEIWIIDHSTTPWESMGHAGGRYGKGGDLLYRWGNPANYDRGTEDDQQLFGQHDAQWIPEGLPGAGNILVFNNGGRKRPYSTIAEITPPLNTNGSYTIDAGRAYGPAQPAWEYDPDPPERFFSWFISGVQRLPNGNTLVNQGAGAKLREVTVDGDIVWEYGYHGTGDVPHMLFRANKYPPDHPGILMHMNSAD
jgi:hypothetical protein